MTSARPMLIRWGPLRRYKQPPVGRTLLFREIPALRRLRDGETRAEAARAFDMTRTGFGSMVDSIYKRFEVHSLAELLEQPEVIALLDGDESGQ